MHKSIFVVLTCLISLNNVLGVDFLPIPNSQKGQVVFVNKQSSLPTSQIDSVCKTIEKATRCKAIIGAIEGSKITIEIIDDATSPLMTAYPEDYRAIVNIRKLDKNLKGKALEKFYLSRCRKELLRAFCFACGAGASQYPNNIMAIGDITDLDLCDEFIPGDTATICQTRLIRIGITPVRFATYGKAVREGWAPAPTNEYQKAIWDKIHAMPTAPIKIKPETKKVRE